MNVATFFDPGSTQGISLPQTTATVSIIIEQDRSEHQDSSASIVIPNANNETNQKQMKTSKRSESSSYLKNDVEQLLDVAQDMHLIRRNVWASAKKEKNKYA